MNDSIRFGKLASEVTAQENLTCREIVREISLFGVSERQRLLIIYLLAMEIEDIEKMRAIVDTVKEVAGKEIFLSGNVEEVNDGSTHI